MTKMIDKFARGAKAIAVAARDFLRWVRLHRGAAVMAGVLSFAAPVTFFTGAISVMADVEAPEIAALIGWFVLFGVELWALLLLFGYALQRLPIAGRYARWATFVGAVAASTLAEGTNGRSSILVEQGVAQSPQTMHVYAIVFSMIMALLFFAHLRRSRAQEQAAARLAAAQAAQIDARRRLVQARLQAVQARIDPHLLFEMLDIVRRAYEDDAARAEELLDELVAFLRAALPRLRTNSSSVQREVQLARAYAQLRTLAGASNIEMSIDVAPEVAEARFPPGVLLPLLNDALRARPGLYAVKATRSANDCVLVLTLPAQPLEVAVARVRTLLEDLYGSCAELALAHADDVFNATVKVPLEPA